MSCACRAARPGPTNLEGPPGLHPGRALTDEARGPPPDERVPERILEVAAIMEKSERERISRVLIIEDDEAQRFTLSSIMEHEGFGVISCGTAREGLERVKEGDFGVAIVDLRLPDLEGTRLLERIGHVDGSVRVIIHTAYGSFDSAMDSVNRGAFAYVEKASDPDVLVQHVHRAFREQMGRYAANLEKAVAEKTASLRHSEERLRLVLEGVRDYAIFMLDTAGLVTSWSPGSEQIKGFRADEILDRHVSRFFPPDAVERGDPQRHLDAAARDGRHEDDGWRVRSDGARYWANVVTTAVSDREGNLLGFVKVVRDETARRRTEEALRESENRYRSLFNHAPISILTCDGEGTITSANQAAVDLFGIMEPENVVGRHNVFHDCAGDDPPLRELFEAARAGQAVRQLQCMDMGKVHYQTRREGLIWFHTTIFPIPSRHGDRPDMVMVQQDMTAFRQAEQEREALEDQLRHAQKLEAIGTLAAGVAHDFNNLLLAISAYTELARSSVNDNAEAFKALDGIRQATQQATGVTKSLLTFSRRTHPEMVLLDLGHLVQDSTRMLRRILPANIEMKAELPAEPGLIRADATQIQQVLMNLVLNARDAMPSGGELTIRLAVTGPASASEDHPGTVRLVVADTGCGIPEEIRDRILEPFFTTKARGQGTGLGMAVVYGIVEGHQGQLHIESRVDEGTEVTLSFPRARRAGPSELVEGAAEAVTAAAGETLLLAEDNPQVRELIASVLAQAGYTVLAVNDGEAAMRRFEEHTGDIALAVLDADLPRRSGMDCLEEMRRRKPGLPVLVISGAAAPEEEVLMAPGIDFLPKPFGMPQLTAAVSRLLQISRAGNAGEPLSE